MLRPTPLFYFFLLATTFLLTRCANQVTPQGGPKDITPPKVIACTPDFFTRHFTGNSFKIDFDEFVVLKNPATEVYISPPLKTPLEPKLHGKSLVVKFDGKPDTNTTYSITFGNAITDLTEGNVLKGFNYVFSTGSYIDSLSLQGTLVSAFDHAPEKDIFVELYLNNNDTIAFDSLPLHVPPYYITKTDENGNFIFNNLQNKKFKLFALSDKNGDLIFNQPSEKIAFYDSLVTPYYFSVKHADTVKKDSIHPKTIKPIAVNAKNAELIRKTDSIHAADSLKKIRLLYPSFPLFLFEETDSVQRLQKSTFVKEGMALFKFRFPVKEVHFVPLNFDSTAAWCLEEYSATRDSVTLWITRLKTDSLILKVVAGEKVLDTVTLGLEKRDLPKKSSKKTVGEQLAINNPAKANGLNQFKYPLTLSFSFPLTRWNFSRVLLIEDKDTLHPPIEFTDSLKRHILVKHKWKEDKNYTIIIPDSVFFGINDISHDSIRMGFRTKAERDIGNLVLSMNMEKRPGNYIIQLMNEKESMTFEEQYISQSGKIHFNFLPPGKYKVKAIHDRNNNRHWDTGNFRLNLQPEEVIYLPKLVEIRANWDVEENWD